MNTKQNIRRYDKISGVIEMLETAVELHFCNRSFVSVCVLANSAWEITKDLCAKKGVSSSKNMMLSFYPEEKESFVYSLVNKAWNFFKHADKDPNNFLYIPEDINELYIMSAIGDLTALEEQSTKRLEIYRIWFVAKHISRFNKAETEPFYTYAQRVFPDLEKLTPEEQINLGKICFNNWQNLQLS